MCFSLVFACLSVCLSVGRSGGWISGALPCYPPHLYLPAPPWEQNLEQVWSPIPVGVWQGLGLYIHSGSRGLCVCVCVHVCTWEPVCKYVQGLGSHHRGGRWGCLRQGLPGVASSQVDSPQVSGCCDGVALRAQLLGTQGPQPALLAVHMPTLDGR